MEKFKFNFYNINACGYYSRNRLEFGCLQTILLDFKNWVKNKSLNETCTFSSDLERGEILPVYCFDIAFSNDKNDIVLITWNETETIGSGMASVNGLDPVGNPKVETTTVPTGHIPGYPTYFWFSIPHNSLVTIRLDKSRLNGHQGLKLLLGGFLSKFSKYTVIDSSEDNKSTNRDLVNVSILGYQENEEKELRTDISPRFWTSMKKIDGEIDLIKSNCNKISKIFRKDSLHTMEKKDKEFLQKLFENIGGKASTNIHETKIKYEISIESLNEEELNNIIEKWNEDPEEWSNVGFKIDGMAEPKWLSHSIVKTDIEINVDKTDKGIVKAESLLDQIVHHKKYLISLIER
ncbi:hypothetical protein QG071_08980 [Kingella kingae]|uniref:hypothetical protein n=3 Tax=Kingella kingae TaxID=504 RepID=UPI00040AB2E9|nr:hypothetical protein [Kingella kingae]MDK4554938.1 hypothetical protein [Kingella kingae]MDK4596154.1 hypothetical protein [Kingella kingae]MDK4600084.1 hypothetical protein [Kingella kingae]MDK4610072.1 hypothetical protein [Kingella kingae]MDK4641734.1 hypothetical protein [Kingella kingae]